MILSMTSYGRATASLLDKNVAIEIKTLNSKFIDLRLKVPPNFHEKEIWLRKHLQKKLLRGKVEIMISFENSSGGAESHTINRSLFSQYVTQLQSLSTELDLDDSGLLGVVVRLPDVISTSEEPISDDDWAIIKGALDVAVLKLLDHRREEGKVTEDDLEKHVRLIAEYLVRVEPYEKERVEKVRKRMSGNLAEYLQRENVDENRFEQEVLFYLEKIDITEEKVRLKQHCDYFLQIMSSEEQLKGRKLNFISQEIGREINTLGAKAYSSDIQKIVVLMKDELEKIKEQLANVV